MNTKFYFPILALALSVAACNDKKAATQTGGIDVANLDRSVTPNQDFYQFACGGWMQAHPLTDEYGRFGSFDLLAENNRKQMQGLIEELAAKKSEPGSVARKIGDLYNMAMDTVKLNGDGSTPIQPVLEKIKAVKTPKEMVTLVAEMTRQGFGPYFGIYIGPDDMNSSMNLVQTYQGGLGLGDRDYYLKEDEHSKEIRTKYQEHIVKMFELAGWEEKEARQAAADVMAIETRLAEAAYEKVKMRDPHANYHKMSVEELKKETAIQRISKMALISDFTVVGIGGVDTNATIIKNSILTPDDYLLLKKQGAVGDILSHFIDINGNLIDTDLEKRLMSPALTDIEKYNNVVGVAGGPHKIEAIYAVLTGKYLDVLITDENTATAVLDLYQSKNNIDTERKDGALQ